MKYVLVLAMVASQLSLASGWNCREKNGDMRAKIVNKTTNPRVPAVFVISDAVGGTAMAAKEADITKQNLSNGVRYSAYGEDSYQGILFVKYREGAEAPLKNGQTVYGKLIVIVEGEKASYDMVCSRYLKNK